MQTVDPCTYQARGQLHIIFLGIVTAGVTVARFRWLPDAPVGVLHVSWRHNLGHMSCHVTSERKHPGGSGSFLIESPCLREVGQRPYGMITMA